LGKTGDDELFWLRKDLILTRVNKVSVSQTEGNKHVGGEDVFPKREGPCKNYPLQKLAITRKVPYLSKP